MIALIVTNPFGGRDVGDRIAEPDEIGTILAGEHAHHVVVTEVADLPPDAATEPTVPTPKPKKKEEA